MSTIKNNILIFTGFLFLLSSSSALCQDMAYKNNRIGINIGAHFAIGSHFQRLGINLNLFYVNRFFQTNSEVRAYFSFKNLGPKMVYPECVLSQGIVFGFGGKQNSVNPFITSISNQTQYLNSIAYSYNAYFNTVKTKQQTGTLAFQFNTISVIAENDILGHTYFDRFRTGGFLIQYQHEDKFQVAINSTLWTGEMGNKVMNDSNYKARCYIDTTNGRYTQYSHGLLSLQFKYNIGLSQSLQANVGVDAERVRNAVQNKFIHDMPFIPKKMIKPVNCHIPMLDIKGNQYLYRPEQKIKKPELYWNVFSNAATFY